MENMRTRFIIAVTGRLSAAADSTAKVELIEELSETLYSRWQDLVNQGMDGNQAYDKAMEDLGSVEELLAYLDSLGPEGELPRQEAGARDYAGYFLQVVKDVHNETVSQMEGGSWKRLEEGAYLIRADEEEILITLEPAGGLYLQ